MEKQTLYINIAKRTYPLQVSEGELDIMRKAEQMVNDTLDSFGQSFQLQSTQDLLAMSAFQLALSSLAKDESASIQILHDKIDAISRLLENLDHSNDTSDILS
ncbi:MAG: cell division protein ZapA [Flavobacteriales bacterium]